MTASDAPAPPIEAAPPRLTFQERAEIAGFRLASTMLAPFGPARRSAIASAFGRHIGARLWLTKRITANLAQVRPAYDAATRQRIVAGVMDTFARTAVEYEVLPELFEAAQNFPVQGLEHLHAARDQAGGKVVVVSAHLGNWEAMRAVAAIHGVDLAIIYRAFNNRAIDDACYRLITSTGLPAFHKGNEGARALFKHLRHGGAGLILVDQRLGGAPVLDFMGRPAETSLAAAQLSRTLKAPLLPAVAWRNETSGALSYTVRFEPIIPLGEPAEMMQQVNHLIAGWVDAHPEQWFWLHRRWKIRNMNEEKRRGPKGDRAPDDPPSSA